MGFLIKCAFWLGLVLLFVPMPQQASAPRDISAGQAFDALSRAMDDAKGFCGRNPEACATGSAALQTMGERAQYGSRLLADFIAARMDETRSTPTPPPAGRAEAERDTLTERDREAAPMVPLPPQRPSQRG